MGECWDAREGFSENTGAGGSLRRERRQVGEVSYLIALLLLDLGTAPSSGSWGKHFASQLLVQT